MTEALMRALHGQTYRGSVDSPARLPDVGEVGDIWVVGDQTWIWSLRGSWVVMEIPETDSIINIEWKISAFEGVMIMFRKPGYERAAKNYPFAEPVQDCEPIDVLRKRLATMWPGYEFEIMDGRSRWDHTHCKTMGQLRNSYLMSRSPE